jgi:hypothetical protein
VSVELDWCCCEMKDEEVFSAIVPVVMGSNAFDEVLLG